MNALSWVNIKMSAIGVGKTIRSKVFVLSESYANMYIVH